MYECLSVCLAWHLFQFFQHVIENIEEEVNVVLLEYQRRPETNGSISTTSQQYTCHRKRGLYMETTHVHVKKRRNIYTLYARMYM